MIWLQFFAAAVVIMIAGYFIVRFAEDIARETGLGRVWAGVILLATATSLPPIESDTSDSCSRRPMTHRAECWQA